MRIGTIITEIAAGYLGYREIGQNDGFENQIFQKYMEEVGWNHGDAWCSYFCELVYKQAYAGHGDIISFLDKTFSGSAVQTLTNFGKSDWQIKGLPVRGSLAIWQRYKNGVADWRGHIAIVEMMENDILTTLDGNSNSAGSSNGYEVARVKRVLNFNENNGLRFKGFVIPKDI